MHLLPNKVSTSVGRVPENPAKSTGKKATFVPHLFGALMRRMATRVPALNCYCITQSNRFWSQLARRAAPGSRFRLRPAGFVLGRGGGGGGCLLIGQVFVLMQQKKKQRKSLYSGLSIDESGACDTAAAPQRSVTR